MQEPTSRDADRLADAERFGRDILPEVSRTFALSIRVLPGALGRSVLAAYLLCRIADTLEDEPRMPADAKAALLDELLRCFDDPDTADAFPARLTELCGDDARAVYSEAAGIAQ
ncbi:MAG: squalene/phytoene synthase family protein, partial [Gemmatimonadaceae bacterium]